MEIDLRRKEELLREYAEVERPVWLQGFEAMIMSSFYRGSGIRRTSFSTIDTVKENMVYPELKRRCSELHYYKTANGYEVDFACSHKGKITNLIQVVLDPGDDKTRNREIRALVKALDETGLKSGATVTYEEEGELSVDGKQIRLIPAFQYLLNRGTA
ncbi:MAG: hypothetical protein ACOYL3_20935 [Desulfuromonadaceae bacterium]